MDDIIGNYVPYENKLYIVYKINGNSVYIRNERNMKNTKQITLNKYKQIQGLNKKSKNISKQFPYSSFVPLAAGGGGGRIRNRLNECLFIISRIDGSQNKYCVNYDLFRNHLIPEEIYSNNWKRYDSEEIREDNKGKIWIIQDAFTRNGKKMYQIQPFRGEIGENLKSIPITEWASYRKILHR